MIDDEEITLCIIIYFTFILIRFISIGVLEPAQTQNTTTSTILIIARRYGGKIYKIVFLYMEQYYRVYSYTLWLLITISNYGLE